MAENSDINTVLSNSLSGDAATRNGAEQQLSQAAEINFPLYLATLVQSLADENTEAPIRVAAGLALKNSFTAREFARAQELQAKWLQQTDDDTKKRIKELALQTLSSANTQAGAAAAQVIASISALELPRDQWPELMGTLVNNVSSGAPHQKQSSLTCIGYICESPDPQLRAALIAHSNAILTAVVQGARKEETNPEIRLSAISALGDSLEFVGNNFRNEGERNYIMQVVCEATQADDSRIQQSAFGCLNRIMALYYENMRFYMEKALFGLTILGMKNEDEDVAKLAVEFWSTVCEEEISIKDDNAEVQVIDQQRPFYNFARVATGEVVPTLLTLLTKQDEDATDNEYNLARAAYQCLQLYAQAVDDTIIGPVLQFVEANLRSEDWHYREAAVASIGAIMEGPPEEKLVSIVKQALPIMIAMMEDTSVFVKDSTAYAISRVIEACSSAIDITTQLEPLLRSLFAGVHDSKMAPSCCLALIDLSREFSADLQAPTNPLTPHFNNSVQHLLQVAAETRDATVRTASYEVLSSLVQNAATDSFQSIAQLSDVVIARIQETIPMQNQVVTLEDKLALEEMQTSLCTVLGAIMQRLDKEIAPQGDRIMEVLLQLLNAIGPKSSVPEAVFGNISGLTITMEEDFIKYMEVFGPYLQSALSNIEEPSLCSVAVGLVSDITRALRERSQPYIKGIMSCLQGLYSAPLEMLRPAILQCFGDIALAIGGHFGEWIGPVAATLQKAAEEHAGPENSFEVMDYVLSLREGTISAWESIIGAMKDSNQTHLLNKEIIESIRQLLEKIFLDSIPNTESLLKSTMGVIGELADCSLRGDLSIPYFVWEGDKKEYWVYKMVHETVRDPNHSSDLRSTARWARSHLDKLPQPGHNHSAMEQT